MKKIFYLLAIPAAVLAMSTSCSNLNTYPVFDDANAFVAFGQTAATVAEDAGYVNIPIVLSSVAGISTTITYELVDGEGETGAKAGVDFIVPDDLTATFSESHRIDTISIQIINRPGDYTKDLSFTVRIANTGTVTDGAANECRVTITDLDHPLSDIVGTYTATDANGTSWSMSLVLDDTDDTMIWIQDIAGFASGGWPLDQTMFYGVVDHETLTITIPVGQETAFTYDVLGDGTLVPLTLCVVTPDGIYNGGYSITGITSENGARIEMSCEGCTNIMPGFIVGTSIYRVAMPFFPIVLTK